MTAYHSSSVVQKPVSKKTVLALQAFKRAGNKVMNLRLFKQKCDIEHKFKELSRNVAALISSSPHEGDPIDVKEQEEPNVSRYQIISEEPTSLLVSNNNEDVSSDGLRLLRSRYMELRVQSQGDRRQPMESSPFLNQTQRFSPWQPGQEASDAHKTNQSQKSRESSLENRSRSRMRFSQTYSRWGSRA